MKRETLEKIRNILEYLFVLFMSILIILITFGSLSVHAEESASYGTKIFRNTSSENSSMDCIDLWSTNSTDLKCFVFDQGGSSRIFVAYYIGSPAPFSITVASSYIDSTGVITNYSPTVINSQSFHSVELSDGTIVRFAFGGLREYKDNNNWSIEPYVPIYTATPEYPTLSYANYQKAFFEHLILTGDLTPSNMPSIDNPDFQDTAYAFTGFTANNKMTATWTGTTERSYLKDQDVEEYTTFTYGFATSEDQTVSNFIEYAGEYATADKKLKLPWDEMDEKKKDGEFIRQVNITPCYRVPGAFYRGVSAKVYFHKDGSIDKIVRDFPQSTGDYSYKHIFSSDKYSTDIPAPELSAVSHNGFTLLNNSDNQYYVDIILESSFYGVKMEKDAGTWLPVVDTDWVYNKHYYNFADTSQIAINNDVVYIPNLYSVNPENELITDFKNWSSDYPTYSKLPTMSFLKRGTPARVKYEDQFLYKENSKYTDSEQIRFSHQAESVFYVRYYNKSMVYGPWVRYKFRDAESVEVPGGNLGGAIIDVGQVDVDEDGNVKVDENGNPVVSDNVHGRQDYNTGESNFNDGSFSLSLSDVNSFFDYIQEIFKSITGSLSSFGSLVAACFGFLPSKLINAIIFGIVLMMFIGLIKVVKG